jgi:hypothetical protein
MISLTDAEEELSTAAVAELQDDLRFEHLDQRSTDQAVWGFLCDAYINRDQDHVEPFIRAHEREPIDTGAYAVAVDRRGVAAWPS